MKPEDDTPSHGLCLSLLQLSQKFKAFCGEKDKDSFVAGLFAKFNQIEQAGCYPANFDEHMG